MHALDSDSPHDRILALRRSGLSVDEMRQALQDEDPQVREAAAQHPGLTDDLLSEGLKHEDPRIRRLVLRHPSINEGHLESVLFDHDLRDLISDHPKLSREQGRRLVNDELTAEYQRDRMLKSTGYVEFPHFGQAGPVEAFGVSKQQMGLRMRLHGHDPKDHPGLQGATVGFTGGHPIRPHMRGVASFYDQKASEWKGNRAHETQHGVLHRLTQDYGQPAADKALAHVQNGLSFIERRALKGLTAHPATAYAVDDPEEHLAYAQSYLNDHTFRGRIHKMLKLRQPHQQRAYAATIKSAVQKMRDAAFNLHPEHIGVARKSEQERLGEYLQKVAEGPDLNVGVQTPHDMTRFSSIESHERAPGVYHHIYRMPHAEDLGYTPVLHAISGHKSPFAIGGIRSTAQVGEYDAERMAKDPETQDIKHPFRSGPVAMVHGTATHPSWRSHGFGQHLYEGVAQHHGQLISDAQVSPSAGRRWKSLTAHPDFKAAIAAPGSQDRHWAQHTGEKSKPYSVIANPDFKHTFGELREKHDPQPLGKTSPPPAFPRLHIGPQRRETQVLGDDQAVDAAHRRLHAASARTDWSGPVGELGQAASRVRSSADTKNVLRGAAKRLGWNLTGNHGYNQSAVLGSRYLDPHMDPVHGVTNPRTGRWLEYRNTDRRDADVRSNLQHEDLHGLFGLVERKYGQRGRRQLAQNLVNSMPHFHQHALRQMHEQLRGDSTHPNHLHEEMLASLMNYMNGEPTRDRFHRGAGHTAEQRRLYNHGLKSAYRALQAAAAKASEKWTEEPQEFSKAEDPLAHARLLATRFANWHKKGPNGQWPADCLHIATSTALALQHLGHKVSLVGGAARGADENPSDYDPDKSEHWWLNVEGKHFDPKSHTTKIPYSDYQPRVEWTPDEAAAENVEDVRAPLEHMLRKAEDSFEPEESSGPSLKELAQASIKRMKPEHRQQAQDFFDFVHGMRPRPLVSPAIERHLARFGVVDPSGYSFDQFGHDLARPLAPSKRSKGGAVPDSLAEHKRQTSWADYNLPYQKDELAKIVSPEHAAKLKEGIGLPVPWSPPAVEREDAAQVQHNTPEFKNWFQGSHVVDHEGQPLVALHGTSKDFSTFNTDPKGTKKQKGLRSWAGELGSWFAAPSKKRYSERRGIHVHGNYDEGNAESVANTFAGEGRGEVGGGDAGYFNRFPEGANVMPVHLAIKKPAEYGEYEELMHHANELGGWKKLRAHLEGLGHDGVVVRDSSTDGNTFRDDWVAFHPHQIKSKYNARPTAHPDITKIEAESPLFAKAEDIFNAVAVLQAGASGLHDPLMRAAAFLAHVAPDEERFRVALALDLEPEEAALKSVGLEPTAENLHALRAVMAIQAQEGRATLHKALGHDHTVLGEDKPLADLIQECLNRDDVADVRLQGKHTGGTRIVTDRDNDRRFLLKPGSGALSPAAGVKEETASQSKREVAFWEIGNAWGIGDLMPSAALLTIDGVETAVMPLLPSTWENLDKLKASPHALHEALEPLLLDGRVHRMAILDFVLGNADSHGSNVMVGPKSEGYPMRWIDHGSTFAGTAFDPGHDTKSFIPFTLRAGAGRGWKTKNSEERLRSMPTLALGEDQNLRHWVDGLDENKLVEICSKYGIRAEPSLHRLDAVRRASTRAASLSGAVNEMWLGL